MHLTTYFQPEFGYQEYFLARAQVRDGHEVYVVTSDLIYPFEDVKNRHRPIGYLNVDGIHVYRLPHLFEIGDFVLVVGLGDIIKKIRPEIVHAHELRQGFPILGAYYKKKYGYKYVVDQHDYGLILENGKFYSKLEYNLLRKLIIDYALKKADKIIAIFEKGKEFLNKKHKIPNNKIKIIPLAADTELYKFENDKRIRIRKTLNIPTNGIVFIFSGSAIPFKKIQFLISAFLKLLRKYDNIYLILICGGNTNYSNYLKGLVSKAEKKKKIIFLDYMEKEKLPEYFCSADIGVFPAVTSISILEQMACKLAIICPDLKTTNTFIQGNGIIYKEITAISIYNAMEKLILDGKLREEMREKSLKLVEEKFTWKKVSEDFINEYIF